LEDQALPSSSSAAAAHIRGQFHLGFAIGQGDAKAGLALPATERPK